jgi:hypothetical protein
MSDFPLIDKILLSGTLACSALIALAMIRDVWGL